MDHEAQPIAPIACDTEALLAAATEEVETICSISLWRKVNERREVCGLPPLEKDKRGPRELAKGLLEMRGMWVKGEDWAQRQPGDDPLLRDYMARIDHPMPRTVFANISYEGIATWRELRVPKMMLDHLGEDETFEDSGVFIHNYYTKHRTTTKHGTLTTRTTFEEGTLTMDSGHGLTVGQIVSFMWRQSAGTPVTLPRQGCRIDVEITSVATNVVKFIGGKGDPVPGTSTSCFVMTNVADTFTVHVWRRHPNPTCSGVARVCERMKFTATARQFDPRIAPEDIKRLKTGDATGVGRVAFGNTINQWDNELTGWIDVDGVVGSNDPGDRNPAWTVWREPALSWDTFENLNHTESIGLILRTESEVPPFLSGIQLQYIMGTDPLRCVTVNGLTWPGIVYGKPNPDFFPSGIITPGDEGNLWVPVDDGSVTDFPFVEGSHEYWADGTQDYPWPSSWMKDFAQRYQEQFVSAGHGPLYVTTTKNTIPSPSLTGSISLSYLSCPDWSPYAFQTVGQIPSNPSGQSRFNTDPAGNVNTFVTVPTSWAPQDMDGASANEWDGIFVSTNAHNWGYIAGSGAFGLQSVAGDHAGGTFITPAWCNEITELGTSFTSTTADISDETIRLGSIPRAALSNPNNTPWLEIVSSGMGPPFAHMWQGEFTVGWQNIICEFDILGAGAMAAVDADVVHNFQNRIASIGVTGKGVTNVNFNRPEFGRHGAEVWVWRRRIGSKTIKSYGADLYTHSVKHYKEQGSLFYPGNLTIPGAYTPVDEVVVTGADIAATSDVVTTYLPAETTIHKWSNDTIAAGLPSLPALESVPENYVNSINNLTPGTIYSAQISFKDVYYPFIKYRFAD